MKNMVRLLAGMVLAAGVTMAANAQTGARSQTPPGGLQVAVTYTAGDANLASNGNHFWLQGGSAELSARIWHGLGETAKVTGLHVADSGAGVPVNLVVATFGPRYTWDMRRASRHPLQIFGEGLLGVANGIRGVYPAQGSASTSANSFAEQVDGGVDYQLNRHFSLRLIQAGWLRTELPNATNNVQNNLLLGAGIVFRLPR